VRCQTDGRLTRLQRDLADPSPIHRDSPRGRPEHRHLDYIQDADPRHPPPTCGDEDGPTQPEAEFDDPDRDAVAVVEGLGAGQTAPGIWHGNAGAGVWEEAHDPEDLESPQNSAQAPDLDPSLHVAFYPPVSEGVHEEGHERQDGDQVDDAVEADHVPPPVQSEGERQHVIHQKGEGEEDLQGDEHDVLEGVIIVGLDYVQDTCENGEREHEELGCIGAKICL